MNASKGWVDGELDDWAPCQSDGTCDSFASIKDTLIEQPKLSFAIAASRNATYPLMQLRQRENTRVLPSYSLRCRRPNRQAGPHKFAQRHCTCSCEGRPSIASVRPSVMSETTPARSQRRDALHRSVQRRANKKQNQPFRNPMQLRNGTTPQYFPLSPQVCAVSGSRQHQLTPL